MVLETKIKYSELEINSKLEKFSKIEIKERYENAEKHIKNMLDVAARILPKNHWIIATTSDVKKGMDYITKCIRRDFLDSRNQTLDAAYPLTVYEVMKEESIFSSWYNRQLSKKI